MTDGHDPQQQKPIFLSVIAIVIILIIVSLALWRQALGGHGGRDNAPEEAPANASRITCFGYLPGFLLPSGLGVIFILNMLCSL
jgi:hypothetical protein